MQNNAAILFLFAETPVHAGAGGAESVVDLPIQRSVQTKWPILNDGTMRGGFRRLLPTEDKQKELFGTGDAPGKLSTPDAEILLFPVTSASGLTAWVTCLTALRYFRRNLAMFQLPGAQAAFTGFINALPTEEDLADGQAWVASECKLHIGRTSKLVLESDAYTSENKAEALADWFATYTVPFDEYWRTRLRSHLAIVSEAAFTHYARRRTDIRTRILVKDGKVGEGPWREENLPMDTLMYAILATENKDYLADFFNTANTDLLQVGGDQNLGRGIFRWKQLADAAGKKGEIK